MEAFHYRTQDNENSEKDLCLTKVVCRLQPQELSSDACISIQHEFISETVFPTLHFFLISDMIKTIQCLIEGVSVATALSLAQLSKVR